MSLFKNNIYIYHKLSVPSYLETRGKVTAHTQCTELKLLWGFLKIKTFSSFCPPFVRDKYIKYKSMLS